MKSLPVLLLSLLPLLGNAEPLPIVQPESVGFSSDRLQQISNFAQENIDAGKHMGIVTMVARHGKIVHFEAAGQMGLNNEQPMQTDTLFRIFSMTKPITSVAMLMLYEEGKFQLNDPVAKYLPEFADMQVMVDGQPAPARSPILIEHLFTHTAGLSYGWIPQDPVDELYREAALDKSGNSAQFITKVSALPLRYEPGTAYFYGVATDVLGVLIEKFSGQTLEQFFQQRIFAPLGMEDTFFSVPEEKRHRFADLHVWDYESNTLVSAPDDLQFDYRDVTRFSGGGGLVSTAMDYMIFCDMLRGGGSYNGVRILGPKTVQYMTINHLPDGIAHGAPVGLPDSLLYPGQGFGLGVAIVEQPGLSQVTSSRGAYSWGGLADTKFWIDPEEDLVAILMTQLLRAPHADNTRYRMKVATYQALTDLTEDE